MAKRVEMLIGVSADTSKFEASILKAFSELSKVSQLLTGHYLTSDLKEASIAALSLQRLLEAAMNVNTGKLDLSKLALSLLLNGTSLLSYANKLLAIGPTGEKAFLSVASAVAKAEMPLMRSSKLMQSLWTTMKNTVRWLLTSSMLNGFVGSLEQAYGYSKSLDASLNNIRIVTLKSSADMAAFAELANKAAKALSTTTTDYTDASLIYYQQGLSDKEVEARTNTTIKMANVSGETAEKASELLTAVWNNFYDGSKSLDYYADVMVKLGAATASSSDEISEGLQKFAAVADSVGLSYEYAAAALATVTATTRESADIVGTAYRTLFARIQGLQLGETLDDGTTLNKYSTALDKVGVSIKDQNGEMKTMDAILDDLGGKWNTISKDQQIALAETVAGVRQYTQLIALMDHWDFFKKILATAYGSSGALQEQADIYAESWEAARDRVKAATEDVYDSLINPDFFISVDDVLTPFLSGLAKVIDTMGGFKGIILTTGSVFTSVFHKQLTQGLLDIGYNIASLMGKTDEYQLKIKQDFGETALRLATNSAAANPKIIGESLILAEDILMLLELNSYARELTEIQTSLLSGYKDIITLIKMMTLEYQSANEAAQNSLATLDQLVAAMQNVSLTGKFYKLSIADIASMLKGILIPNLELTGKSLGKLDVVMNNFKELNSVVGTLTRIQALMKGLSEEDLKNTLLLDTLKEKFLSLTNIDLSNSTLEESQKKIEETILKMEAAIERLLNALLIGGIDGEVLDNIGLTSQEQGAAQLNQEHAMEIASEATFNYHQLLIEAGNQLKTFADLVVTTANQLMNLGLVILSFKSLGSIWNDADVSLGDKIISTLTSIGMIAPQVIAIIRAITSAKKEYIVLTVAGVGALAEATLRQLLATGQEIVYTLAVNGSTKAIIAKNAALSANPFGMALAILSGLIALISAVVGAYDKYIQKQKEAAQNAADEAKETTDAIRTEQETIESLEEEYTSLRAKNDDTVEGKEALKNKTKELCEALGIEWSALDQLGEKYDEINKKIAETEIESTKKALKEAKAGYKAEEDSFIFNNTKTYTSTINGSKRRIIDFAGGFDDSDEKEVTKILQQTLESNGIESNKYQLSGTDFSIEIKEGQDLVKTYEAIDQARKDIASNKSLDGVREESEVYKNMATWLSDAKESYEQLKQYKQDLIDYSELLANAELKLLSVDISLIETAEQYELMRDQYVKNMEEAFDVSDSLDDIDSLPQDLLNKIDKLTKNFTDKGIEIPDDVQAKVKETIKQYFEGLADAYFSGYDNLSSIITNKNAADEIAKKFGEDGDKIVNALLNEGYDLSALARVNNWSEIVKNYNEQLAELLNITKGTNLDFDPLTSKVGNIDFNVRGSITWDEESIAKYKEELESIGQDTEELIGLTSTVIGSSGEYEGYEIAYTPLLSTPDGLQPLSQNTIDKYINSLIEDSKEQFGEEDWSSHLLDLDAKGLEIDGKEILSILAGVGSTARNAGEAMHYLGENGSIMVGLREDIQGSLEKAASDLIGSAKSFQLARTLIEDIQSGDVTSSNISSNEDYTSLMSTVNVLKTAYPELTADAETLSNTWMVGTQGYIDALNRVLDLVDLITLDNLTELADKANEKFNELLKSDDTSSEHLLKVQEAQEKVQLIQALILDMATSVSQLEELAGGIKNLNTDVYASALEKLASQYENTTRESLNFAKAVENLHNVSENASEDEKKAATETYNNAKSALEASTRAGELAEQYDLSAQAIEDYASALKKSGKYTDATDKALVEMAKDQLRFDKAVISSQKNMEDWVKDLKVAAKTGNLVTDTAEEMREAYGDLLDIDGSELSDSFLKSTDNLELMLKALKGDQVAYEALQQAAQQDIEAQCNITMNDTEFWNAKNEVEAAMDKMNFEDIEVGATIDDSNFIAALENMVNAAGMTAQQATDYLSTMGIDAEVVNDTQSVPETVANNATPEISYLQVPYYAASQDGKNNTLSHAAYPILTYKTSPVTVNKQVAGTGLKVTSASKSSGGNVKFSGSTPARGGSNGGGKKGSGGGGGGGGSAPKQKTEDLEKGSAKPDRYRTITRTISNQSDLLDEIATKRDRAYGTDKLIQFNKAELNINKQLTNQKKLLNEANSYLKKDADDLLKFLKEKGNQATFDPVTHEITNYDALEQKELSYYTASLNAYNNYLKKYNAMDGSAQENEADNLEALKKAFEKASERWEDFQDKISQYDETVDKINETTQAIEDLKRELADLKLEKIDYKLLIVLDVKDMKDSLNDLAKDIAEMFGDALTHGIKSMDISQLGAEAENGLLPNYQQKWDSLKSLYEDENANKDSIISDIKDLQGEIIGSAQAIAEWIDSIEDVYSDAIDAAAERFALFTDQLNHNSTILDTIKELYGLQGVLYKTSSGFSKLQKVSQEQLNAHLTAAKLLKQWFDEADERLADAQAKLDSLNGNEDDIRYDGYKKAVESLLEQRNTAQEAYLSEAQSAMEAAKDMYIEQIEKAVYDFGQAISNGVGLDSLQDQYDHYIDASERYFDKVNEGYQVASWYNKLQKDIDDSTNEAHKKQLKVLQQEIDQRREGNKLSQYDLDILNAKYELLQAQLALEDAQNAKDNLRLVRDSQGNWNYQYSADQDKIADAQQKVLDAQNNWYNIAKDQVTDITGLIVSMWKECQEKVQEIYEDDNLTRQEKEQLILEVKQYYSEKAKYLEEEKGIAIKDMNEAASAELVEIANLTGEKVKDITEDYANDYADKLSGMTENNKDFGDYLEEMLKTAEDNYNSYKDTINDVAKETGTTLNELKQLTKEVANETEELGNRAEAAAEQVWKMADEAANATDRYYEMAQSLWATVEAMRALASELSNFVSSKVNTLAYDINVDYSALIAQGLASGKFKVGDAEYNELIKQRKAKIEDNQTEYGQYDMTDEDFKKYENNPGAMSSYMQGKYSDDKSWEEEYKKTQRFATGGYTGEFDDAKLAFLHEKELVLNQDDTKNVLAAVEVARDINSSVFASIEKALDNSVLAIINAMGSKLVAAYVDTLKQLLEQVVHIDKVEFPSVTSRTEIEEAFNNLTNDAAQWARRRN